MPMWRANSKENRTSWVMLVVLLLGLALRFYGVTTPAQYYDMNTFHAWALHMLRVGPANFYTGNWSDYLPLPLYSFAPISLLAQATGAPFGLVFKIVVSVLEVGLIAWITWLWSGKGKWLVWTLLMLSPALIGDTAFWGQIDTIPALLAAIALLLLTRPQTQYSLHHTIYPSIIFGLAVAIKPIVVLSAPIIWIVSLKRGQGWWQFPLFSALTFFATGLPMAGSGAFKLMWSRTIEQAATYPFTTINAWNLWSLVPTNYWPPDSQIVLGVSAHTAGLALFVALTLNLLKNWRQTKFDPGYSLRVAATILIVFFTFTTRMHERHLLFGLPLLALATVQERWLLFPLSLLTLTFTLNLWAAYWWVGHDQTWPVTPAFISVVSWITTLTALALATVWHWPSFLKSLIINLKSNKLLVGILIIAAFLRLYNLVYPQTYIFDEVYHAFTARQYLHNHLEAWQWWTTPPEGVAYEWTHPGVAKYGMVGGMLLFGENSFGWRIGSAVAGAISILGLYLFIHALVRQRDIALLSAFLLAIEGLHIAQSRIAMNDVYMLAFFIWSLYAAVRSRWKLSAVLFGLALGSKWSAIYGALPLALIYLYNNPIKFSLPSAIHYSLFIIRLISIAALVYILTFAPFILAGHTWEQFIELHRQMWYYHTHLEATHGYQSTPLQWIFAARPVWYYVQYLEGITRHIYAQANPLILWLGLVALIMQLTKLLRYPYSILYILYFVFTLPWLLSPRIMFFYHYLPSATFLSVILATWVTTLPKRYILVVCFLFSISLLLISPMLYAIPLSQEHWNMLFSLFPSWK